jgi:lysophospholipase L1-like esterase
MERHLAQLDPGSTWQVWNLGQPATNQVNHAARFARLGPQIQPDVVLIVVLFNDLLAGATRFRVTEKGYLASLHRTAPYPDWARPFLDRSVVFHLAISVWYAREKRQEPGAYEYLTDHLQDLLGGLGTTVQAARRQGARVGVVLMPGRYEPEGGYAELAEGLRRWSAPRELPFIDLGGLLGVPLEAALALPRDSTHLNEVGAGLVGERLATEVVNGLVSPP